VCPSPRVVQEALRRYLEFSNEAPAYTMWKILEPAIESVRERLAGSFGVDPEELAITRNASEALEIVQMGLDLEPGDEVLTTNQDYGRMLTTWDQRVRREGITVRKISFPVPPPSMDDLVRRFEEAIGPRTRVLHFCHITNLTGQIFPVGDLVALAKRHGLEAIVDGAHAYAHFPFTHADLGCDFYGTSLHKWLLAPIGTGFLHVRKERIPDVWPLMAATEAQSGDIRKFEEIGTHPAANHNAIAEALTFHEAIGGERKAARLRFLRDRWMERVEGIRRRGDAGAHRPPVEAPPHLRELDQARRVQRHPRDAERLYHAGGDRSLRWGAREGRQERPARSMTSCCHVDVADRHFGEEMARRDAKAYLKNGVDPLSRTLLRLIGEQPIERATLLDIGGGVGVLGRELLGEQVQAVTMVDESTAYLGVAREQARGDGTADRYRFVVGDVVEAGNDVGRADLATLHRVVCCYPDYGALLEAVIGTGVRWVALTYPRDRWYVRVGNFFENLKRRIRGNPFRTFVHAEGGIVEQLEAAGFRRVSGSGTLIWTTEMWAAANP
jgi:selenocysteine lyase/cysteine desulfurase